MVMSLVRLYEICIPKVGVRSIGWWLSSPQAARLGKYPNLALRNVISSYVFFFVIVSLDDKLFSFWHLQAEAFPFSHVKGIFRKYPLTHLRTPPHRCSRLRCRSRVMGTVGTGRQGSSSVRLVRTRVDLKRLTGLLRALCKTAMSSLYLGALTPTS